MTSQGESKKKSIADEATAITPAKPKHSSPKCHYADHRIAIMPPGKTAAWTM